ncbi:YjbH domain-containing protein [Rhodobacteraceae bacterium CY05]|uniref:YjbH domain-containing protein n=2 Tax=Parasedimentitalea huanghaiensis TaxID=2682100 RepID=A0A6L6WMG4_9RHOB|nr:YjbH domain-containing protein [Zongyanglinia huanghaiensis]MVO18510.1 YjbH domain-containing protein [Zongyanglinia huanghaiensis]
MVGGVAAAPVLAQDPALSPPSYPPLPAPSLNFYGSPGLLDMPSAEMQPDGQFSVSYSWFGGQARYNLTFQALPWLSASFRYNGIQNLSTTSFSTYYDRGFDVRARLWREGRYRPEVTMGLQDFAGTGVYAAEYFVATKQFQAPALGFGGATGKLKLSAGLGWGRLGSYGAIGNIGTRSSFTPGSTGGTLSYDQWFRGDFAPFGGIEWQPNARWGFKLEYSSDAYVAETQDADVFVRKSQLNFGAEYQATPRTRLGAYYLYGSEVGVTAQIQLNPFHPVRPMAVPAPLPIVPRSDWAKTEADWSHNWAQSAESSLTLRDQLAQQLEQDGLILESLEIDSTRAEVRFRNPRYRSDALAIGRTARVMSRMLPASVETFRMVPVRSGMGLSATEIRRSDLEMLEHDAHAADALVAVAGIGGAAPLPDAALVSPDLYPAFSTSVSPYSAPAYFDPDQPFRLDLGLDFKASYEPAPGWVLSAALRQRLWGNVKNGRASNSKLPHVRTDQMEYAQYGTTLENLFVSRYWQPDHNLYARATAGLFESMYGGVSAELLWKPVDSPLALGFEANYVVQRDFDQRFSFRDYKTFTGHASAYYELGGGYQMQLDAGRYLAGDYGGTLSLDRVFDNGWRVGGFVTLTDVSAEDFGEGSFDKGFRFDIPLDWMLGKPSRNSFGLTVRPVQRDGGQRVYVPGRLYGQIRDAHRASLIDQRARMWE